MRQRPAATAEERQRMLLAEEEERLARSVELSLMMKTGRLKSPEDLRDARRYFGHGGRADSDYDPFRW